MDTEAFSYALCFNKRPNQSYHYIKSLGEGSQGAAQLVWSDAPGRPLVVRKVERPPIQGSDPPGVLNEVRISELLTGMALTPNGMRFDMPMIIPLLGSNMVRISDNLWARESYWFYCNGGTAYDRMWAPNKTNFTRPPYAAIGKYVRQVGSSLLFMRFAGPEPVYHHDLHLCNILVHWVEGQDLPDFYIADLGWSSNSPPTPPRFGGGDTTAECDHDMICLWKQLECFKGVAKGNPHHRGALQNMISQAEKLTRDFTEAGLRDLVQMGQRLEHDCTNGGIWDERESDRYPHYKHFVLLGKEVLDQHSRLKALLATAKPSDIGSSWLFEGDGRSDAAIKASRQDVPGPWYLSKVPSGDRRGKLLKELGYGGIAALSNTEDDEVDRQAEVERELEAQFDDDNSGDEDEVTEDDEDDCSGDDDEDIEDEEEDAHPSPVSEHPARDDEVIEDEDDSIGDDHEDIKGEDEDRPPFPFLEWESRPWHPKSLGETNGNPYPYTPDRTL